MVFNLSSWAEKRQPIAEWLVEELNAKYYVRKTTAQDWVEHDDLLLLIDGLDEVREEHREACVQAINAFRRECGVPVAICSRVADYEALTGRLDLRGAVLLQPLTPEQMEAYLNRAGEELAAVQEVWRADPVFQQLVESPLMLNAAVLAYRGMSLEDLQQGGTIEDRRRHVFDTYVERAFMRTRESEPPCTREQAIHWLSWLARQMTAHAQTEFLIEGLQPDWLPEGAQRRARIVARLILGLVPGLGMGLNGMWLFGPTGGWIFGLFIGLVSVLAGGLLGGLRHVELEAKTVPNQGIRQSARNGLVGGLLFGLLSGSFPGLFLGLGSGLALGLGGLVLGVGSGLMHYGGASVTLHLVLRAFLHRYNDLPWRVALFLDYCTERIFLRKVGGGYIFVHRLLQEYFASLYEEEAAQMQVL